MITYNFFSSLTLRLFTICSRKLKALISPKKSMIAKNRTLGFTLIEILVVVAMVGILSAIAAPSWLAFTNNQRLAASQTKVFQAIKTAQSDAKIRQSDNSNRSTVTFTTGVTSGAYQLDNVKIDSGKPQSLDQGVVILSITPTNVPIQFDSRGFLYDSNQTLTLPICINLSTSLGQKKKWVKIQTLLGAITTGVDNCT